jgi:MerR family regulatory protein
VRQIKALPADRMPIGELSRLCGVHIETIRYYEKIGTLPAPPRTESGRRVYGPKETLILVLRKTVAQCSGGKAPDCPVLDILDVQGLMTPRT